jgi:hypothetical protein
MIVKPSTRFLTRDKDSDLVTDIQKILAGMTGNASYPKAVALLLLVKAALGDFSTALANAGLGGTPLTALKGDQRKALCALVRSLALDVTEECHGDLTVLLSSGFPIQKPEHYPIGDLPKPVAPVLARGTHSGELDASVAPVYGTHIHNWRLALASAPDVILQTKQSSATYTTFAGLIPGQIYLVQVSVAGTASTSDWSQAAILMVV